MGTEAWDGGDLERIRALGREDRAEAVEQVAWLLDSTDPDQGSAVDRMTRARLEGFVTGFRLGRE